MDGETISFYDKSIHTMKLLELPIDKTLTPFTANKRGYTYAVDVSSLTTPELHDELVKLVEKEGFKVGQPQSHMSDDNSDRGLYAPLAKNKGVEEEQQE
jgi:hypothetical protein